MSKLTLEINERTKAGKAFIAMFNAFFIDAKGIEIIQTDSKKISLYDPEFVKKIKRAEDNILKGKTRTMDPKDIWGSLGLKKP